MNRKQNFLQFLKSIYMNLLNDVFQQFIFHKVIF